MAVVAHVCQPHCFQVAEEGVEAALKIEKMPVLRKKVLLFIEFTEVLADELGRKRDVHVDSGCLCARRLGRLFGPLRDFIQFGNSC